MVESLNFYAYTEVWCWFGALCDNRATVNFYQIFTKNSIVFDCMYVWVCFKSAQNRSKKKTTIVIIPSHYKSVHHSDNNWTIWISCVCMKIDYNRRISALRSSQWRKFHWSYFRFGWYFIIVDANANAAMKYEVLSFDLENIWRNEVDFFLAFRSKII